MKNKLNKINKGFATIDQADIDAVNAVLAGKKEKFAIIYKRYYAIILQKYSSRLKFNNDLAEDLTAEVFVRVFENMHKYQPHYTFNSWITRVSNNFLIDYVRKQKLETVSMNTGFASDKMKNDDIDFVFDVRDEDSAAPDDHLIIGQRNEYMEKALSKLDEPYRAVVNKRFYEEKSYDEIAHEMGMTLGTVKSIIFRAKDKLKEIITADKVMLAAVAF